MKLQEKTALEVTDQVFEYSENPDQLKELLSELKISATRLGKRDHFQDSDFRETVEIEIERNERIIHFNFGMSLYDTEWLYAASPDRAMLRRYDSMFKALNVIKKEVKKVWSGLLYSVLCSCGSNFYCPIDFDEFCSDYGYDNDSIKAKSTWLKCLKQSSILQKIFSDSDIECMPS